MQSKGLCWKFALISVLKCKGISSAKTVDKIKAIICDKVGTNNEWLKIGHGGTLDETATGVLVIGTGLGCKVLSSFLSGSKCYRVSAQLGIETDTLNNNGKVVKEAPFGHVTYDDLKSKSGMFVGNVSQVPPKYCALKIGGRRISDLTREGVDVPMMSRQVQCLSIKLISFEPPYFELEVQCGGGFYVRSLIRDIALALNTCAHVTDLHRTKHGFLTEQDSLPDEDWTYEKLLDNAETIRRKSHFRNIFAKYINTKRPLIRMPETELWVDPT